MNFKHDLVVSQCQAVAGASVPLVVQQRTTALRHGYLGKIVLLGVFLWVFDGELLQGSASSGVLEYILKELC